MSLKKCSKCFSEFECCNTQPGCWCEGPHIASETLEKLKKEYNNCLCPCCLKGYSMEETKK